MRKKELAKEVIERLKKEYPDAGCSLEYDQAWKLLVSVRLAAQCTDARSMLLHCRCYRLWQVRVFSCWDLREWQRVWWHAG